MQDIIQISTHHHDALYDITSQVKDSVRKSGIKNGMVSVYVQGATCNHERIQYDRPFPRECLGKVKIMGQIIFTFTLSKIALVRSDVIFIRDTYQYFLG